MLNDNHDRDASARPLGNPRLSASLADEAAAVIQDQLGLTLRPTQIDAAGGLLDPSIVELPMGEGKTLSIAVAAIAMVRAGRRVFVATANDYLATRDCELLRSVFQTIGITAASITANTASAEKQIAYDADVLYSTLRQFGFDYLNQRMDRRSASANHRHSRMTMDVLLVDEADSVLIDEARTPLVMSSPAVTGETDTAVACRWSADFAKNLSANVDFVVAADTDAIALTALGHQKVLRSRMPAEMNAMTTTQIIYAVETALDAALRFRRDQHYIVAENQIQLVDEFTGRGQVNRTFAADLHQAIQAREGVAITPPSMPIARITIQEFVACFAHLSGTTATAWEDRREIAEVYGLSVRRLASWKPSRRIEYPAQVYRTEGAKLDAIADEIQQVVAAGRAVLVGTRTIEKSEQLSRVLQTRGLQHVVLNARHVDREAEWVKAAGTAGQITVATNMAGRGTDIPLDASVADAGGLHVIVSEPHSAARIDRQLIGRAGRQGDPGSCRSYWSIDDEILDHAYGTAAADSLRHRLGTSYSESQVRQQLRRAQTAVARSQRRGRRQLAAHANRLALQMRSLGLDPHLDPICESR
ncbi:preprotein translocase, SecA subunit [Rhodopirellula maiorica SM1]|uniref:Preprotein translocase, SecA subunit n=1 Tax=Rhodopirellula maiorica SM1 TaxID=1265738 RepID=M5S7I1_9BACT|nr:preprotein translocase, SecA subunit [Rhodopirellula maiorica]EMI22139.1 preprotein translocase, SecA subunit [Rhodopirellula maiorica SM1]